MLGMKKENLQGLIAVLVGILMFKSFSSLPSVGKAIDTYPLFVMIGALIIFFKRDDIAARLSK